MFNNRSQQAYSLPPSCIYQSSYASYADGGEVNGASHMENGVESCGQQALQATWPNFYPNSRVPTGFDQFVIMSHNPLANQFYGDYNGHAFGKSSADVPQECASQPDPVPADMRGFPNFKCDGRRSTESAVAVSSDGLRSCSVSPEMHVQYNLSSARTQVTKAPQLPRPEFEWMTKTSYQSQPNPGKTRTKDKYRVVYTDKQRLELEKEFHFNRYITIRRKAELAELLGLSERQVKIWFQNRRAKERKQQKKKDEFSRHQAKEQGIVVCHQLNTMSMGSPNLLRPLPQFEHQNASARTIALY